jgi:hypothetical protein
VIADDADLHASGRLSAQGWFEHEAWIAQPTVQALKDSFDAEVARTFPHAPKIDDQIDQGLIGVVADHHRKQLVVVVDDGFVDVTGLQARLQTALTQEQHQNPLIGSAQLPIRVQTGCNSAAELTKARSVLQGGTWYPEGKTTTAGWYLDGHDSTYHVTFTESEHASAEALRSELGDLVTIDWAQAPSTLDDRADDGQPHWGGARIGPVGAAGNTCSSGFTVDTASGGKAMITAGHCFDLGQAVESGDEAYGAVTRRRFPRYDMAIIDASNQNYDDDLYHDPYYPETQAYDVEGGGTPGVGDYVCVGGGFSLAECYVEIMDLHTNHTYIFEGQQVETPDLMLVDKPGVFVCNSGDSGGPYYRRPNAPGIRAVHGIHHGRLDASQHHECLAEKYVSIKAGLDVTAATSP